MAGVDEMNRDILTVIQENMSGFSKGQKRIANYILESYDKAAFMTASKLGKTVDVSESTVVRFASELGYDGYPSMQKSMQKMIRNRLTAVQRIEVSYDRISESNVLSAYRNEKCINEQGRRLGLRILVQRSTSAMGDIEGCLNTIRELVIKGVDVNEYNLKGRRVG